MLSASNLRQLWQIVQNTQAEMIVELSDSELVQQLQEKLEAKVFLSPSELNDIHIYINSKILLIRALGES